MVMSMRHCYWCYIICMYFALCTCGATITLIHHYNYCNLSLNCFEITSLNSSLLGLAPSLGSTPLRSSSIMHRLASLALVASTALSPTHHVSAKQHKCNSLFNAMLHLHMTHINPLFAACLTVVCSVHCMVFCVYCFITQCAVVDSRQTHIHTLPTLSITTLH